LPGVYYAPYERLIKVVHIPTASNGRFATAVLNGEIEKALIYLK